MIFSKPIKRLVQAWHTRRMSELGLELHEALLNDKWEISDNGCRFIHMSSGITLSMGTGVDDLKVHDIKTEPHTRSYYENAINKHDRVVLWDLYGELRRRAEMKPADLALNHLRLGRIKEHGENK